MVAGQVREQRYKGSFITICAASQRRRNGYDDISEEDILKIASKWCVNPESLVGPKEKVCFIADYIVTIKDDYK